MTATRIVTALRLSNAVGGVNSHKATTGWASWFAHVILLSGLGQDSNLHRFYPFHFRRSDHVCVCHSATQPLPNVNKSALVAGLDYSHANQLAD